MNPLICQLRTVAVTLVLSLSFGAIWSCNYSTLTLDNVTSLGGNLYTFDLTMCAPGGCTATDIFGTCINAEMNDNTGTWGIGIDPSSTITGFTPSLNSPMNGSLYTGALTSASTFVTYSNSASNWWTNDAVGVTPSQQFCTSFTITTSGFPTDICAYGLEGGNGLYNAPSCPQVNGVTCVQPAVLGVEFLEFRTKIEQDAVKMDWIIGYEEDHDRYVIEHSLTGSHFTAIGEVPGVGNTEETQYYGFKHFEPVAGVNHYRIAAVDLNGLYQYSNSIQVRYEPSGITLSRIYPNPSPGLTHLEFISERATPFTLKAYDMAGRLVHQDALEAQEGRNTFHWDKSLLSEGQYVVHISGAGRTLKTKVLK